MKCQLCQGKAATLFSGNKEDDALFLCEGCSNDVKKLYSLAKGNDSAAYNKFKQDFLEDFCKNECSKKIVNNIEKNRNSTDSAKTLPPKALVTDTNNSSFLPFKLFFATMLAIFSALLPCFGIGCAFISYHMSSEIPLDYSLIDVNRARKLSRTAIIINLIEIAIAIVTVIAISYF